MVRITDPELSRAFYEALGFRFEHQGGHAGNGELEATNYFFSLGDQESVLELTFNHDGRTYDLGTGYGHIAVGVDDLAATLAELKEQGIEPEREPYRVRDGGSLICFVRDPDGYRIELIGTRLDASGTPRRGRPRRRGTGAGTSAVRREAPLAAGAHRARLGSREESGRGGAHEHRRTRGKLEREALEDRHLRGGWRSSRSPSSSGRPSARSG